MDCSLPGSSVHEILQARILEWVAISYSRGSSDPGIKPRSPALLTISLSFDPPGNLTEKKGYFKLWQVNSSHQKKKEIKPKRLEKILLIIYLFFGHKACRILVPWPNIEPMAHAVEVWHPNHWTTREFPTLLIFWTYRGHAYILSRSHFTNEGFLASLAVNALSR